MKNNNKLYYKNTYPTYSIILIFSYLFAVYIYEIGYEIHKQ